MHVARRGYRRIALAVLAFLAAVSLAGAALAYDPKLDDADAALVKGRALVDASEVDANASAQKQRDFDRHRQKAMSFIDRARAEIAAAKAVADAP